MNRGTLAATVALLLFMPALLPTASGAGLESLLDARGEIVSEKRDGMIAHSVG